MVRVPSPFYKKTHPRKSERLARSKYENSGKADKVNKLVRFIGIFLIIFVVFLYGRFVGLEKGIKIGREQVSVFSSPSSIPTPTSTLTPSQQPDRPSAKKTGWGGPELWEAINKRRIENGVGPLNNKPELCTIASIRLNELLELGET